MELRQLDSSSAILSVLLIGFGRTVDTVSLLISPCRSMMTVVAECCYSKKGFGIYIEKYVIRRY